MGELYYSRSRCRERALMAGMLRMSSHANQAKLIRRLRTSMLSICVQQKTNASLPSRVTLVFCSRGTVGRIVGAIAQSVLHDILVIPHICHLVACDCDEVFR